MKKMSGKTKGKTRMYKQQQQKNNKFVTEFTRQRHKGREKSGKRR